MASHDQIIVEKNKRNWFFLILGATADDELYLQKDKTENRYKYLDWRYDVDINGLPLIKGYIELFSPRMEKGVRNANKAFTNAYLEVRRGDRETARKYLCYMDTSPKKTTVRLTAIKPNVAKVDELIRAGKNLRDLGIIFDINLTIFDKSLQNCLSRCEPPRIGKPHVSWHYGTAFDTYILDDEKDYIILDGDKDNWDGYDGHHTVVIKGLTSNFARPARLAHIFGSPPCLGAHCLVTANGYSRQLKATKIIVLTREPIDQTLDSKYKLAISQVDQVVPLSHCDLFAYEVVDEVRPETKKVDGRRDRVARLVGFRSHASGGSGRSMTEI